MNIKIKDLVVLVETLKHTKAYQESDMITGERAYQIPYDTNTNNNLFGLVFDLEKELEKLSEMSLNSNLKLTVLAESIIDKPTTVLTYE